MLETEEQVARLQNFFADNGEALYGKAKQEKVIVLENASFIIPEKYNTNLPDLTIVPMWAGKQLDWKIVS
jgi:dihydroorotase